jgi:hypothetical protein
MSKLGVFTAQELASLKPKHREVLEQHVLLHLQSSPEVHQIIEKHLKKKTHERIRKAARRRLDPIYQRLK